MYSVAPRRQRRRAPSSARSSPGSWPSAFGWRAPFFVFVVPTFVFVVLAWRLKEPVRGAHERRAMGASEEAVATEEESPSFAEAWRIVWKIETLRRIWYSLPFLAASLIGFVSLAVLLYEEVFDLDERARGFVAAAVEPVQLVGLIVGARIATRAAGRGPRARCSRFLAAHRRRRVRRLVVFALAPNSAVAIAANVVITGVLAILGPGILAALSLAIPPGPARSASRSASLWVIPGLLILPIIGALGDRWGIRQGMLLMVPIFLIGGWSSPRTKRPSTGDIAQVWKAAAARSEALLERRRRAARSCCWSAALDVSYGNVQVLFDVDLEVDEGEIVALLGTNGAGKSTLLKAISGVVEADRGAVIFDGRDITHAPPNEIAALGIAQVPGGKGVFPSLTVGENLRLGGLAAPRRAERRPTARLARVLELFPSSPARQDDPAGDLRAASSRCSPSAWPSSPEPAPADDRRAVARPRAGRRRRSCSRSCEASPAAGHHGRSSSSSR